jgi:hypothetical protein
MNTLATIGYRMIEKVDGEKGPKIIPYRYAEAIKLLLLGMRLSLVIHILIGRKEKLQ